MPLKYIFNLLYVHECFVILIRLNVETEINKWKQNTTVFLPWNMHMIFLQEQSVLFKQHIADIIWASSRENLS